MYLRLNDLTKIFDEKKVVDGINLSVEEGQFISLVGPSGCGKTTTLKMIGGFLQPDVGSISIDGMDIVGLPPEKRPTSTVFQSYALFPHMNVFENVSYGLKYKKLERKKMEHLTHDMIDKVGLNGFSYSSIGALSGGQQQRVALARAIITHPKVLLLDEPLSNLDVKLRIKMRSEIRRIQKELNITALYVTHDQEEALSMSDVVVVMKDGVTEQIGTAEEIYRSPVNSFVADFMGRSNIFRFNDKLVAVHPEDLEISNEVCNNNSLRGIIDRYEFRGALTTWFIYCDNSLLEVDRLSSCSSDWKIGEEIYLSFRDDRVTFLDG